MKSIVEFRDSLGGVEITPVDAHSSNEELHEALTAKNPGGWDDAARATATAIAKSLAAEPVPEATAATDEPHGITATTTAVKPDESALTEELSDDTRELHAHLKRVHALPDRNDPDWRKARTDKERAISKKIFTLAQATNAPAKRKTHKPQVAVIIAEVKTLCAAAIEGLKITSDDYSAMRIQLLDDALLPGCAADRVKEIDLKIGAAQTTDEMNRLISERTRMVEIDRAKNVQFNAVAQLNRKFRSMEIGVEGLERAMKTALDRIDERLLAAEREFFIANGFPHERTSVSKAAVEARQHLLSLTEHYRRAEKHYANQNPTGLVFWDGSHFGELFD